MCQGGDLTSVLACVVFLNQSETDGVGLKRELSFLLGVGSAEPPRWHRVGSESRELCQHSAGPKSIS